MKNKILIGIVLIVLMGVSVVLLFLNNSTDEKKEIEIEVVKEEIKKDYTFDEAVESLVIENCDFLIPEDIDKKSLCIYEINFALALKNNDIKFCELILDKKLKFKCGISLNKQILKEAFEKKDQKLCLLITTTKDKAKCIGKIDDYFYENNNCKKIYTSNYKGQCFDKVDSKTFLKAREDNNPDFCNSLSTETLQNTCFKDVEYSLFLEAKSLDSCSKIGDSDLKKECTIKVKLYTGDYDVTSKDFCNKIKKQDDKDKCLDGYYLNIIESGESNSSLNCKKIINIDTKNYCLSIIEKNKEKVAQEKEINILIQSGDEIGAINLQCESTKIGTDVDICKKNEVTKIAISNSDITICEGLETEDLQKSCKNTVSYELDTALFKEAISKNDKSICNNISVQEKIDFCLNYLSNN